MSTTPAPRSRIQQVVAAVIGNTLEWYDFIVYGFMTTIIAKVFFPIEGDEFLSMLLTTATFGVGFFMRPVGGILLGIYADRKGRKAAMQLIIGIMTLVCLMIALAPPYAAIGIAAPLIIVLARLLQGFATGGEYASATAFLVESAPENRKGLYGSWQLVGQMLAVLGGAGMGGLVTATLDVEQLHSWGWRIPFAVGLLIGPVGLWIRRHMQETDDFVAEHQHAAQKPAFIQQLKSNWRGILMAFGLTVPGTASFYVLLVSMPSYASRQFGLPLDQAFGVQMIAVAWMTLLIPLAGLLSDYIGRRAVLLWPLVIMLVLAYPAFTWLNEAPSLTRLLAVQLFFCTLLGINFGPAPTAISELFPVGVRSTGISIGYNIAAMLFGGFAAFNITWLREATGSPIAPVFYILLCTAMGVVACWLLPRGRPQMDKLLVAQSA